MMRERGARVRVCIGREGVEEGGCPRKKDRKDVYDVRERPRRESRRVGKGVCQIGRSSKL